ncbi:MAG: RtcB family protein, partial [Clostridia bacterium]
MIEIKGKFNAAKAFTNIMEDTAAAQIQAICDLDFLSSSQIRIMPDVHAGAGCTIGTTLTIDNAVIPNLVGVDIGCGMEVVKLVDKNIDLPKLDDVIRTCIPSGKNVHDGRIVKFDELQELFCFRNLRDSKRIVRSIGTLGGGNHFIEANKDDDGNIYIVIHSGSRNLGKQVADFYQNLAIDLSKGKEKLFAEKEKIIAEYKSQGRKGEIQSALKECAKRFKECIPKIPSELAYLTGQYFDMYIHDMKICQEFATLNRKTMMSIIIDKMGLSVDSQFTTIHNYIDMDSMILRKGAVSAKNGETLIIPMNMRDGSLICKGKGNADWNFSAPHGAGRLMSRTMARERMTLAEYAQSMEGIYTTSVNQQTIDEAPDAYKPMAEIME